MEELTKRERRYQVEFDDATGFCTLVDMKYPKEIEFAGVSQMINYCKQKGIDVAIEDCIVSNVKNY
ncbi:MAG: hypothetical protein IJ180_09455 [Bacteroidales bacterium]|nr:hypothetical protein [Bacteroidales bacterium]